MGTLVAICPRLSVVTLIVVMPCGVAPVTTAGDVAGNPVPVTAAKALPKGRLVSSGGDGADGAVDVPQAATIAMSTTPILATSERSHWSRHAGARSVVSRVRVRSSLFTGSTVRS